MNNTSLTAVEPSDTAKFGENKEGYFWLSIFIIEAVIIIILNILTIVTFVRNPSLRKRSAYFLINLSITDACIGAFVIPISIFRRGNIYRLWNVEITHAWFISTYLVDTFFFGCSLVFLVSISIERLHATTHPMRHRMISSSSYRRWVFVVWAASVFYTAVTVSLLHFGIFGQQLWYIVAGCVLTCLLTLSCCYVAIFVAVRHRKHPDLTSRLARRERKLTMTLLIVTVVSLSVWLPYVLFTFLEVKLTPLLSPVAFLHLRSVCEFLFFANSFVNPILYTIRMPEFRKAIGSLLLSSVSSWLSVCSYSHTVRSKKREQIQMDTNEISVSESCLKFRGK